MEWRQLQFLEQQSHELEQEIAQRLRPHAGAVERLAEVPGLGVESAHQILAEIGPPAEVFPSQKALSSWVGVCPGEDVIAGEIRSSRSPKGNRALRRLLNEAAHAAVKMKGAFLKWSLSACSCAWTTRRRSGPLLTACAVSFGRFCTKEFAMKRLPPVGPD